MKKNRLIKYTSIITSLIFIFNIFSYGQNQAVITLGNDLNQKQRKEILELFNVVEDQVSILEITNQEERDYLEGVATEAQIGTRAISSAYVEKLKKGEGITVSTYNISWVTKDMIQNALITAGVTDAKVIAAAPFEVSGTAALTGILKAFEEITGQKLDEDQKKVANEEVVETGKLGDQIGKEKATELIRIVKEEVVEKKLKDSEEIKKIVVDIAGKLDINLNVEQILGITKLMEKINKLNLNTEDIRDQLKGIGEKLDQTLRDNEEVKSLIQKLIDMIKSIFDSLFNMFKK